MGTSVNWDELPDYEDNFGYYNIKGDLQEFAFMLHVREHSVSKRCERCKREVRLLPTRYKCATCVEWEEFGGIDAK